MTQGNKAADSGRTELIVDKSAYRSKCLGRGFESNGLFATLIENVLER